MISIARAAQALHAIRPDLSRPRRQMFLGQAKHENYYGNWFKTPDGSDSNNWGAIYAPGDRGTIPIGDTYEGKPITMGAAWNSTPEVGARQFVNLISGAYPEAWSAADTGNAWAYAKGLWRKGPLSSSPSYYTGFPPGHKWSLAPKGTVSGSPLDHYYRILAYARAVAGASAEVARAIGEPAAVHLNAPPPPTGPGANVAPKGGKGGNGTKKAGGGDGLGGLVLLAGGGYLVSRMMK